MSERHEVQGNLENRSGLKIAGVAVVSNLALWGILECSHTVGLADEVHSLKAEILTLHIGLDVIGVLGVAKWAWDNSITVRVIKSRMNSSKKKLN